MITCFRCKTSASHFCDCGAESGIEDEGFSTVRMIPFSFEKAKEFDRKLAETAQKHQELNGYEQLKKCLQEMMK
jgi:uncharacterized protein YdaT